MVGLYLGKAGEKAKDLLDGVALYATPWSAIKGSKYFVEIMGGWYNYIFGMNLTRHI